MPKRIPLTDVPAGQTVSVVEILGGHGVHGRLRALGIRPGTKVTKISAAFARGPVVLKTGGSQTALGAGISGKIVVEAPE